MRWFKHLSAASDDEKLAELIDRHGAEGYGIYWLILEKIADKMVKGENRTNCKYSSNKWAKICGKNPRGMRKIYETFEYLSLFIFIRYDKHMDTICQTYQYELDNNCISFEYHIDIDCPNLLKYRDEYSKKSGQTPDIIRSDSGQTPDQETETETETDNKTELFLKAFEKWWLTYPKRNGRRIGKKKAKKKFLEIKQTEWNNLNTSTKNYSSYLLETGLSPSDAHRFLNETWKEYIQKADKTGSPQDDGSAAAARRKQETEDLINGQ